MARMRVVKPEYWTSEQVVECSRDARLLFIGLWNFSDDAGIHPYNPKRIKMEIFPADPVTDEEVLGWIQELIDRGLLLEYEAEGKKWLQVTGWHHQRIDKPTYKHPKPNSTTTPRGVSEDSQRSHRHVAPGSVPVPGSVKEGNPPTPQGGNGFLNSGLVLEDISRADLGKKTQVLSWAMRNIQPLTEDVQAKVLACSRKARRIGRDPPRLFLSLVRTGLTQGIWQIDGHDEDPQ